ncbi:hypothetical protein AVEN_201898-1 [Araneus ventricosus]|uniref:Uncharacterized protein n=1 Tax=Araneus ventricosus TaxID=182803 RepID=A0A4Y2S4E9_ARAVE|nr:hypothetical protein AVEN_201898-1 [Araneus ventricosus]
MSKAGHSYLLQNGNFGTRKGKSNHQGRKPMKFRANYSKRWNSNEINFQPFMRRFPFETPNEVRAAHQKFCLDLKLATKSENIDVSCAVEMIDKTRKSMVEMRSAKMFQQAVVDASDFLTVLRLKQNFKNLKFDH